MVELIAQSNMTAVVGLGVTGLSVARYLADRGRPFIMLDSRDNPPNLHRFRQSFPDVPCELGVLNRETLCATNEIILSPGVALSEPALKAALEQGVVVLGDIELFAREARAPIVAITGSNGKSTVTTLVGDIAKAANVNVKVGGNLGTPVLDLLDDTAELYVVELSSFQLETTAELNAEVATILNLSEDHLDRYDSMVQYHAAKQRIYFGAKHLVVNRADALTQALLSTGMNCCSFGLDQPDLHDFGLGYIESKEFLMYGLTPILPVEQLAIRGRHNITNALAAIAIAYAVELPLTAIIESLKRFKGLAHRCEWVAKKNSVEFFNDSKSTNVGATLAAIVGLVRPPGKIVLIAGGEAKDADFSSLTTVVNTQVRALVLIGRDADEIAKIAKNHPQVIYAHTLQHAVAVAFALAVSGDIVLLSPACASFDMFKNYEDRGNQYIQAVKELVA